MPSFRSNRDKIPSSVCDAHLKPLSQNDHRGIHRSGYCVAFAPDESYVAWSSGNSIVTLLPWHHYKSTLLSASSNSTSTKSGFMISVEKPDEVKHYFGPKALIDATYIVSSLTFCLAKSNYEELASKTFWVRLGTSQNFFLVTGHITGHIRVWDVLTGKLLLELLGHGDAVSHLASCLNGSMQLLSSSYDGIMNFWDLADDGNLHHSQKFRGRSFLRCIWSPNSKIAVIHGRQYSTAYVWDVASRSVKSKLEGHMYGIVACSFSPDGGLIATASFDTVVILWNAHSAHKLKHFCHQHPFPSPICYETTMIEDMAFSADGSHIATVANDGFVRFWDILQDSDPESVGAVDDGICCSYAPSGGILAVLG